MDFSKQLFRSTVYILTRTGNEQSVGTGFFFQFKNIYGKTFDVVVTNKHAVETFDICSLHFRSSNDNSIEPIDIEYEPYPWILHDELDLAILPLDQLHDFFVSEKLNITITPFTEDNIPTSQDITNMSWIENIKMTGYPNFLIDEFNNLPIARCGITATPYELDFNNEPKFLIDASVYRGSSGSPVCMQSTKILLLGILHASYYVPFTDESKSIKTKLPNGLGYVIKSKCLLDFIPKLEEYINS